MSILDRTLTLPDILGWDPPGDWGERQIRAVLFRHGSTATVRQVLASQIPNGVRYWAVMREHLVPARDMQVLTQAIAEDCLRRATEDGVYIDFRSTRAFTAKADWLAGRISNGALAAAAQAAEEARQTVALLDRPMVSAIASLACTITGQNPRDTFRETFYAVSAICGSEKDQAAISAGILAHLEHAEVLP